MTDIEIKDWVGNHYKTMSTRSMAEEMEIHYDAIYKMCSVNKWKPISPKEENKNFILDMRGRMDANRLAKIMYVSDKYLYKLIVELGMSYTKYFEPYYAKQVPNPIEKKHIPTTPLFERERSVREILSNFKLEGIHINPFNYHEQ